MGLIQKVENTQLKSSVPDLRPGTTVEVSVRVIEGDKERQQRFRGEVTNVRTGEALGRTDRVRATLTAGDALVLSVAPGRPSLRVEGPLEAARGGNPVFRVAAPLAGKRLVRWHVFGPDGAFHPEYAGHAVTDAGQVTTFVVPWALSDSPGEYRLKVTDVLSGAHAETTVQVK